MFNPVGVTGYTVDVVAFCAAWLALALAIGLGFGQVCRWADRRAAREREMRELLADIGRLAQMDRRLEMVANLEGLVNDVQYARQTARLLRDVKRAPLVAVEDVVDRMAG